MQRRKTVSITLGTAVLFLPISLLANGMRLGGQDSFAAARGDAFVATADNPSAICYNPAGITQLDGHNLRGTLAEIYYSPTFSSPNANRQFEIEEKNALVTSFFYSYTRAGSHLGFGLGVYAPFGGALKWPDDTGFRAVAKESSLQFVTLNPVVGLKLSDNFSVAGGLTINYGRIYLEQGLLRNYLPPYTNYFRFKGSGINLGYNFGVLWQLHENISIGTAFRSSVPITFDGEAEYEQFGAVPHTTRDAKMDLTFPLSAVFGISYRPTPVWNIEFNAEYTGWGSFGETVIRQAPPRPPWPVKPDVSVKLQWESSWAFKFGATRYVGHGWHVSAGYVFNENSVPDDYYTPFAADLDRHFFSFGIGRKGKQLDFDVAYQFGYGPDRIVQGSKPSSMPGRITGQNADGTYDFLSHSLLLTFGLHF